MSRPTAGPDVAAVTTLVERVAYDVVLPRFRDLAAEEVMTKGPGDLVTVVDRLAETELTAGLRELADVPVIGEEAAAADPTVLEALPSLEHVLLVDPIDGTSAFVQGIGDYAVMVAYAVRGEPVAAWVCLPSRGHTYVAERGSGLWRDGVRMGPPVRPQPRRLHVAPTRGHDDVIAARAAGSPATSSVAVGGPLWSGRHYTALVDGELDALGYWSGWPWDHAPGALLVTELGGVVTTIDGSPYRAVPKAGPLVAAADAPTADLLRSLMLPDPRV